MTVVHTEFGVYGLSSMDVCRELVSLPPPMYGVSDVGTQSYWDFTQEVTEGLMRSP